MIVLTKRAKEHSTYAPVVRVFDENRDPVLPVTLLWTLTDSRGNVINDRERVAAIPAIATAIVLSGDDLQILPSEDKQGGVVRHLIIEATYDSTLGTDLPVTECVEFDLANLTYLE